MATAARCQRIEHVGGGIFRSHETGRVDVIRVVPEGAADPARVEVNQSQRRAFQLGAQRLQKAAHPPFGGAVEALVGLAHLSGRGEHIGQHPTFLADKAHRLLGHQYGGDKIALHHTADLLGGVDADRAELANPGAVDHHLGQTAPLDGSGKGHLHLFVVRQIGGNADHRAAELIFLLLQSLITAPHHGNPMAPLNQPCGQGAAQTGTGPRHYDVAHYFSLSSVDAQIRK